MRFGAQAFSYMGFVLKVLEGEEDWRSEVMVGEEG